LLWAELRQTGSTDARERLFAMHAGFARKIAARHRIDRSGDIEMMDLRQLAYAGLLEAIDRYDPHKGAPFRVYAARRITGSVLDGIAKASEMREQISLRKRLRRERVHSLAGSARKPSGADAMQALAEIAIGLALGFM